MGVLDAIGRDQRAERFHECHGKHRRVLDRTVATGRESGCELSLIHI